MILLDALLKFKNAKDWRKLWVNKDDHKIMIFVAIDVEFNLWE